MLSCVRDPSDTVAALAPVQNAQKPLFHFEMSANGLRETFYMKYECCNVAGSVTVLDFPSLNLGQGLRTDVHFR